MREIFEESMDSLDEIKQKILHVCRRLYEWRMVDATGGNVSVRFGPDRVIATPTGMSKGFLQADDLVELDLEGRPVGRGKRTVTSEIGLYLRIFHARPDVAAAIHAHPPHATAFAVTGRSIDTDALPESVVILGKVPLVPYGTPGMDELYNEVEKFLPGHDVFLLANHGALTLGKDVIEACHRMECLEHTAMILWLAESLGGINRLKPEQVAALLSIHKK